MNAREAAFARLYPISLNATKAAIEAGYSTRTAGVQGHALLKRPKIAAAIQANLAKRAEVVQLEANDVLREVKAVLQSNVRHFIVGDDGRVELAEDAPEDAWRAVSSVELEIRDLGEAGIQRKVKLRLWDKNRAAEMAMKHLGMLKEGASLHLHKHDHQHTWKIAGKEVPFR